MRPYLLGGLGATQFGGLDDRRWGPDQRRDAVLVDLGGRREDLPEPQRRHPARGPWTPTYIKSDPEGYWCDPYWGCYTVADAEYSNQFELSGGITLRF